MNSLDDFCIFAPPNPGPGSDIGDTERIEVSWCIQAGYGTRLIPDGAITGAHFVQTPDYVQVTGVGDLTKINIPQGDEGGELDPHGADGNGEWRILLYRLRFGTSLVHALSCGAVSGGPAPVIRAAQLHAGSWCEFDDPPAYFCVRGVWYKARGVIERVLVMERVLHSRPENWTQSDVRYQARNRMHRCASLLNARRQSTL